MSKYQIFNPGEYCDFERELVQERLDLASGKKKFEPPKEMLEFGPMAPRPYTEAEILAFNKLWNPYDPLYNDPAYARSQGLPGVPAMPGFAKPMGGMMLGFPKDIAERFFYTHDGGTFEIRSHIFAGDMLTNTKSVTDFRDVTAPGSDVRIWYMGGYNEMSNQKGEVVLAGFMNTRDAYRKCIDGTDHPTFSEKMAAWYDNLPPAHYTTDADWDYIRELWAKEEIRGENTLYWEDVEIGYEAPKTCSGPITYMHMIEWYGAKAPTRKLLCDKKALETTYRDHYGNYMGEPCYHLGNRNHPKGRMVWYNDTGAYHVYRTITNFIGNQGRVSRFSWRFFPFFEELRTGPICADMFNKVKGMEGRDCDRHGSEGDTCIGRAVVTGKYVNERGEHCIEIAAWGEDLEGNIVQGCPSEAVLPSRDG